MSAKERNKLKGYNHLKTKADKKVRYLFQTWGKIVDIDSMSMTISLGNLD